MWACNSVPAPLTPAKLRHHFVVVVVALSIYICLGDLVKSYFFILFIFWHSFPRVMKYIMPSKAGMNPKKERNKNVGRQRVCGWVGPSDCRIFIKTKKKQKIYIGVRCAYHALIRRCDEPFVMHWTNTWLIYIYIDDWFIHISHGHVSCTAVDCCIWIRSCFHIYITIEWTKKKNVENIIEMMVFSFQEFLESVIFLCVCR